MPKTKLGPVDKTLHRPNLKELPNELFQWLAKNFLLLKEQWAGLRVCKSWLNLIVPVLPPIMCYSRVELKRQEAAIVNRRCCIPP